MLARRVSLRAPSRKNRTKAAAAAAAAAASAVRVTGVPGAHVPGDWRIEEKEKKEKE